ncbi:SH3 domain-containing protein [Mesorhizobium sp. CU2]|uniref:SH3 domain-containing protein n=1 Tax=unclassified Mesorhizobium TaxID=325217 RepID=UPI00112E858A|nr:MULTISPECIES: SH3 domain-containing protein [unclassified Mesorhizobium]TPN85743.1 SH3 domain-containing protein [Mesorhizobium sp. CU3]TPO05446.1 SH3 domain-containing protein [Mesorhizobium sp. CU2]
MRRRLTLRRTLLTAAPLLFAALPVIAQEASAPASPDPIISIVSGLAPDDLLNLRATASAVGKTEARLPSGTSVKNYGCNIFNGYPWCKVQDLKNPSLFGWAPARYLTPNNPAAVPEDQIAVAPPANAGEAPANPAGEMITSVGPNDTAPVAEAPAPMDASATSRAPRQPIAPPPDLGSRLGNSDHAAPPSIATITDNAMQDAIGMAYVAKDNSAAAGTQSIARLEPKPPQAAWVPAGTDGDIPCARYVGEPMTHCAVKVVRGKDGKADITVTWPDGGTRLISFNAGKPAGSDADADFRSTREGTLNMIRIGVSERFEITDGLALGN